MYRLYLDKGDSPSINTRYGKNVDKNVDNLSILISESISAGTCFRGTRSQLQWGFEICKHLKSANIWNLQTFEIWTFWISLSSGCSYSYGPNHSKTSPFKIQSFLSRLQMVFDKMTVICPDFKWLGLQISDLIQNPHCISILV